MCLPLLFFYSNSEFVDFGVDQLDIKKKMKAKLGPNVIMRLKFDFSGTGSAVATTNANGEGYSKLSGVDDDGPKSIQMVSFPTKTAVDPQASIDSAAATSEIPSSEDADSSKI